jgi:DNA-binding CsgD family transcriptional regulator
MWCRSVQQAIGPFASSAPSTLEPFLKALLSGGALGLARAQGALSAFDITGFAAVLLNESGEILQVNARASRLLTGELTVRNRRIVSNDSAALRTLNRTLRVAMPMQAVSVLMPPVIFPQHGSGRPILGYSMRLPTRMTSSSPNLTILLLIDLSDRMEPPEWVLRTCLGLTAAEARLTLALVKGEDIEELSERFGIAEETARKQLKAVFAKLDVHRQSQLVVVLSKLFR